MPAGERMVTRPCPYTVTVTATLTNEAAHAALLPLKLHELPGYCAMLVSGTSPVTVTVGFHEPVTPERRALLTAHLHAVLT